MLVVEDEPAIAMALRSLFRQRGIDAATSRTVAQARELLAGEEPIDWVVLDLMLPDGSGEQLIALARQRQTPARVLVMTGVGDPQRLREVQAMGADAVLQKPISFEELTDAMGIAGASD